MGAAWFVIIHGSSRTRFSHLFATSVDHPHLSGAVTACGVDAYGRFPNQPISFGVHPDVEHCADCAEKEQQWNPDSSGTPATA